MDWECSLAVIMSTATCTKSVNFSIKPAFSRQEGGDHDVLKVKYEDGKVVITAEPMMREIIVKRFEDLMELRHALVECERLWEAQAEKEQVPL